MKRNIPFEFEGKSMETETKRSSKFSKGGKASVEQILGSEERKTSKKEYLDSQTRILVRKLTIRVRLFDNRLTSPYNEHLGLQRQIH